ncbi:MAG: carbohydrate kinase family protein, partial [Patescibacteria group bacterium]|nr:carbohydrate kinase family protein [Patescibacteria group bacterium]
YLAAKGISTDSIHVVDTDTTAAAYIMTDKADNQIAAFYPGAGRTPYGDDIPADSATMGMIAAGCDDDMHNMPQVFRERGIKYTYDPGQHLTELSGERLLEALSGAEVLFANDYELGLIVFKTGLDEKALLERVPCIVATLGAKGARLLTKGEELEIDVVKAGAVVDPTGAGDAHRAGFVKGMLAGLPMKQCAQLASAVASYAVEKYGTQSHTFTMPELQKRYQETYGENLPLA